MDQALLDGEAIVWPPNRLTLRKKLAFAIGGTPAQVSGTVIGFFLTPFLLDVVGMRALNVAHILLVARICDAFSDPLVGWRIKDHPTAETMDAIILATQQYGLHDDTPRPPAAPPPTSWSGHRGS